MSSESRDHRTSEARQALLDQLTHLCEEAEALRPHLQRLPEAVLAGRPLADVPSFKELYALIAAGDMLTFTPAARQIPEETPLRLELPEDAALLESRPWNELPMEDIIESVVAARRTLVDALHALPLPRWQTKVVIGGDATDVFGLVHAVVQRDAALLQTAAYRLHESRITSRDEDLPK